MVRSVLSALPVYFMTCFRLLQWVIKRIDSIRRGFLWGRNQGSPKGMSLINWDTVCMPREFGGMGLLDINLQNISLLLRWWWRPNTEPSAMWTDIITRIRITTSGGVSRWISGGTFFWKGLLKLLYWFSWSCERKGDRLKWNWENSGLYSSRSSYSIVKTGGRERWPFKEVWTLKAPQTVRMFCYLFLQGRILTRDVLQTKNIPCPSECAMCRGSQQETVMHLFFSCTFAIRVWGYISRRIGLPIVVQEDVRSTWTVTWRVLRAKGKHSMICFISGCWQIWLQRNNLIFRGEQLTPEVTAMKAMELGKMWLYNC